MDKSRGSRFATAKRNINKQQSASAGKRNLIPQIGFNAIREDLPFSEKSKKEKVRSLSAVAKALSSYEMGSQKPHDSAVISPKRFKLPKKFINDCNGVDHASVPRKIRSAMKKRNREWILTNSEKVNRKIKGIESPEKDGIKKSKKQERQDWSTRLAVTGPITKDEEEVVETLYALAGMFPHNGSNARSELECESLPDNSSVLQDHENANANFEASETTQDACLLPKRSPTGAAKISSLNETTSQEQTDFPGNAKFLVATHGTTPKTNLQAVPTMVGSENGSKVALHDSELCLEIGLNVPRQSQISHNGRQPDVEFETARGIDGKQQQHVIKYQKENEGPALWPGLSPSSSSAGITASYMQSSAAQASVWQNAAICASKQDIMERCSSGGKIAEIVFQKKSWKRCAAHVHISHLIRSLEVPKRQVAKEPELYECHQMRGHQGSKCGTLMEVHDLNGMRNGNSSASGTVHSATTRNSHETKSGILLQQCHYHDISQAPPTPGAYGQQKQSFNFLSLSAGGNGFEVNDSFNKGRSRLEPLSKSQVPYFQSLQQQHGLMPIPTPQSQYASASYLDQLPAAGPQVRLQQPRLYGSSFFGTHYGSTVSNKLQHQSFWTLQLASQGKTAVNGNILTAQYPNWQSERHDSSAMSPCAQVTLPRSHASL